VVLRQGPASYQPHLWLKEFRATSDLQSRLSWGHALMDEEMKTTDPLMLEIA
jgi:hypothetical protein